MVDRMHGKGVSRAAVELAVSWMVGWQSGWQGDWLTMGRTADWQERSCVNRTDHELTEWIMGWIVEGIH
jgi:hypothetical protein